ncbi:MAG TPA: TolC family protein [Vicinamibacterales bacterium]|jgi:outer membrane protein TolC
MSWSRASAVVALNVVLAAPVWAQAPAPVARVTFKDAVSQAIEKNPTMAEAATGILRAEGLIRQARGATRLQLNGAVTTTTLNTGVDFDGATVTPQNQVTASITADYPLVAAAAWARRAQAQDQKNVADLTVADTRRQVALSAADVYLTIVTQHHIVESNARARDSAKAHFDLATQLEQSGAGSRLNSLRAQQLYSTDIGLVEVAQLALYRAQEALGVLIVVDGPVDAVEDPVFELPPDTLAPLLQTRTDLKLFAGEQDAAERIFRDSGKDWWPTLDALFSPSTTYPSQFFLPANSWRFLLQANVPIFDSGQRTGVKTQRQAAFELARVTLTGAVTQANSQVRTAREAIASGERALVAARAAADQAQEVVRITNISFRAGAATNIEVIDAERTARDVDTAMALVEDDLRRARLDLLAAVGRFP